MSGVLFKVIFVGLFVCSVGSDVSIQGSSATAIIGEPFTITCTGQYDILLIRLGNTLTIFPVYNFLGANADNTCKPSGSFNTNYTYTCTNDSTTLTYSTTIPGKYVTEDLDNSNWTCTNVFDATAKVGFYTLNVTSESLTTPPTSTTESSTEKSKPCWFGDTISNVVVCILLNVLIGLLGIAVIVAIVYAMCARSRSTKKSKPV